MEVSWLTTLNGIRSIQLEMTANLWQSTGKGNIAVVKNIILSKNPTRLPIYQGGSCVMTVKPKLVGPITLFCLICAVY